MKKTILTALTAVFFSLSMFAQTTDEIIAKHIEAIGGKANWTKITTMRSEGTIKSQGIEIKLVNTQVHKKATRSDITVMGMTGYTIITNTDGWMFMPFQGQTKPEPMTADDVKASQQQLDFHDEFLNYKEDGKVLEDLGKEDIDGTECFKLKLTNKNGEQNTYYIDPTDYMVIKMTNKSTTDGQETESSTSFSNYKKLDEGIVVAMNISAQFGDFETTKIEINPTIDEAVFKVQP